MSSVSFGSKSRSFTGSRQKLITPRRRDLDAFKISMGSSSAANDAVTLKIVADGRGWAQTTLAQLIEAKDKLYGIVAGHPFSRPHYLPYDPTSDNVNTAVNKEPTEFKLVYRSNSGVSSPAPDFALVSIRVRFGGEDLTEKVIELLKTEIGTFEPRKPALGGTNPLTLVQSRPSLYRPDGPLISTSFSSAGANKDLYEVSLLLENNPEEGGGEPEDGAALWETKKGGTMVGILYHTQRILEGRNTRIASFIPTEEQQLGIEKYLRGLQRESEDADIPIKVSWISRGPWRSKIIRVVQDAILASAKK